MKEENNSLKETASNVYNYHNLGVNIFPEDEEKTPHGAGERYNFDRMYFLVSNYDFYGKNLLDIGCNSGWFCFQSKLLGAKETIGIDYSNTGIMGTAMEYAFAAEKRYQLGMRFYDRNLEHVELSEILKENGLESFDATIVFSVLHHIKEKDRLFQDIFEHTKDVIFYEDAEFWNELYDLDGNKLELKGEGHRFGWNEDMSWQRNMRPLSSISGKILDSFMDSWRRETLLLDKYSKIEVLGLSEKRRPVLALWK